MNINCQCGAGQEHLAQFFANGETDFRLCGVCGCVFRERFPSPSELDQIYRQAYGNENIGAVNTNQESGDHATLNYARHLLREVLHPGDRLLDYGAGTGALLHELRKFGVRGDGLEFSENARSYCLAERGFALRSNLRDVPDGYFNVISMIEVIEHLTDLPGTLKEVHRVLAPGGQIFVTTPCRTGLRARLERGFWREAQKKFHLFLFDWRSINFHLQRAGFLDVRRKVFSPLQKPGWKFWVYSRITQSIGLSGTLCVLARK
ncbi:class I SAM-dependent methyltransferase [Caenimonas terrae]|uniref:Class I SAM-dependent methyltransferase n=1 Tax=Caenimonas terrae TaxID=696074 RepID=A0ABW0NEG6_9BURK